MHSQSRFSRYRRIFKQTKAISLWVWEVGFFYLLFLFFLLSFTPTKFLCLWIVAISKCLPVLQIRVYRTSHRLKLENSHIKEKKKAFHCVWMSDFTAPQVNLAGHVDKYNWYPVNFLFSTSSQKHWDWISSSFYFISILLCQMPFYIFINDQKLK